MVGFHINSGFKGFLKNPRSEKSPSRRVKKKRRYSLVESKTFLTSSVIYKYLVVHRKVDDFTKVSPFLIEKLSPVALVSHPRYQKST